MDYRVYAYLQTGQDARARGSCSTRCPRSRRDSIPTRSVGAAPGSAGVFALAAIPARYALERGAWADAAQLEPQPSAFPYTEALTYFAARARRRAHRRRRDGPRRRSTLCSDIQRQLTHANEAYWAEQAEIQRRGAIGVARARRRTQRRRARGDAGGRGTAKTAPRRRR